MFTRVVALATAATLFVFAAAAPASQCNAGNIYCCNQATEVEKVDKKTSALMALLNLDVDALTGQVGTNCSPISAVGLGGNSCTSQQVCCQDNHLNGLVVVGCTPINVGL